MKILVVSSHYPSIVNTPVSGFVHTRSKIYARAGNNVKVFVPSSSSIINVYKYEDIDVAKMPWNYFPDVIKDFDPDIMAAHAPSGRWVSHISKSKIPIVSWIHGSEAMFMAFHNYYSPFSLRENFSKSLKFFTDPVKCALLARFLRMSMAVVYVSQWMKKVAEKYTLVRHNMSFVIPNPIDVDTFQRTNLDFESRFARAISVKTLGWKSGLDIAIKAYSNLNGSSLRILGKGSMEKYFRKLVVMCKANVKFTNKWFLHKDLSTIYNKFGYFVAPSRTEAQGVAMCEAMACGLPVVATHVGGIPEFIVNGYNGLLIPPENPLRLREAIKSLISDHESHVRLSENAIRFVKDNLSHNIIYQKEYEVLKQAQEEYGKQHNKK